MAGNTFLALVNGILAQVRGVQVGGIGNANAIPALDAVGRLDVSMMPVGTDVEVQSVTASEALNAGAWVNIFDAGGSVFKCRNADGTVAGKHAHGYVLAAVANGALAQVFSDGANTQVVGMTPGDVFLTTAPGIGGSAPPAAAGNVVQCLGVALNATTVDFKPSRPVTLA